MIANAVKIIRRIQADPELSAFAETQAAIWQDAIKEAVLEERECCAKIADLYAFGSRFGIDALADARAQLIAIEIRKVRGCEPPQAE